MKTTTLILGFALALSVVALAPSAGAAPYCTDLNGGSCDGDVCWYGGTLPKGCHDVPDPIGHDCLHAHCDLGWD
jgi:hypothetical protein